MIIVHVRLELFVFKREAFLYTHIYIYVCVYIKHTRTQPRAPWAPLCGLSGVADGWLIDWGGPLMISAANDLLNNSLGLCCGTDGGPSSYTDAFADRLMHKCSSPNLHICRYTWTCAPLPRLLRPLLTPVVCLVSTTLVAWYHRLVCLTVGTDGKVSRNSYLLPPWLSVLISIIIVSASLCHSGHFQYLFLFKNSSCHRFPYTALLFLEMQNRAPFDTEVNY